MDIDDDDTTTLVSGLLANAKNRILYVALAEHRQAGRGRTENYINLTYLSQQNIENAHNQN